MDTQTWDRMSEHERAKVRDLSGLVPELIGLEGWRVELTYRYKGEEMWTERGIVSRSTGWRPCHILLKRRDSSGGCGVSGTSLVRVRQLYKAR
jgi:hypothetical protein